MATDDALLNCFRFSSESNIKASHANQRAVVEIDDETEDEDSTPPPTGAVHPFGDMGGTDEARHAWAE